MTTEPIFRRYKRFLLCRPHGGLNDTLVQIFLCYRYAKTHRRALVIDTRQSGIYLPLDRFFALHKPDPAVFLSIDDDLLAHLNALACHPSQLQGRIHAFKTAYDAGTNQQRDLQTRISTRLNFKSSATEPLVVHEDFGGGNKSVKTLRLLCLKTDVADEINRRLSVLPASYVALQVRNTDRQSDYLPFFAQHREKFANSMVLLCSDDDKVSSHAQDVFGPDKIINLRRIGGFHGKPLHLLGKKISEEAKFNILLDALTDIMAMAMANAVYVANHESGFGRLGRALQADKALASQLLGRPLPSGPGTLRARLQAVEMLYWRHR